MEPAADSDMWQADVADVLRYLFDDGLGSAQEGFPPALNENEMDIGSFDLALAGTDGADPASFLGQWQTLADAHLKPFNRTVTTHVATAPARVEQHSSATGLASARTGSDYGSSCAGSVLTNTNSGGLHSSRSGSGQATSFDLAPSSMQAAANLVPQATTDTFVSPACLINAPSMNNWEELPPPTGSVRTGKAGRGRGRGRAASSQQQACISKPVKDKKKENSILIRQLEQELQVKLSLLKELEGQNRELKRKERILQLSVDTSEHTMNRLVDHQLAPNLKNLLASFRGTYNRATAERVLARVDKLGGKTEVNIEVFSQTWQALVMEMCDALMAESAAATDSDKRDAEEHLERLNQRCTDFCMAMCAHHCQVIMHAMSINLANGEEITPNIDYWAGVAGKLALTDEQVKDMVGAFDLFLRSCAFISEERKAVMAQLDAELAKPRPLNFDTALSLAEHMQPIYEVQNKLRANMTRAHTLHTMVSFIALRLMTSKQVAQLCMHASPLFPNLHLLLGALKLKSQPLPTSLHAAAISQISQEYRTLINALS